MAAQTYQLVITGNLAGQFVQTVLHYEMEDSGFANKLLAAKGLIDGWLAASKDSEWLAMLPDSYVLMSIKSRCVSVPGSPEWIDTTPATGAGTFGTGIVSSSSGPVLIWYTSSGPKTKGRTFLPGIGNDKNVAGSLPIAVVSDLIEAAETYRANFPSVGGGAVAVIFVVAKATDLTIRYSVIGVNVSKDVGVQRRRQLPIA